jgi:hypothetical protein
MPAERANLGYWLLAIGGQLSFARSCPLLDCRFNRSTGYFHDKIKISYLKARLARQMNTTRNYLLSGNIHCGIIRALRGIASRYSKFCNIDSRRNLGISPRSPLP